MLETGMIFDGKYRILREIAHGGMSVVYLAQDETTKELRALKELRRDGDNDIEVIKQSMKAEINLLRELDHPCLPRIIEVIREVIQKEETLVIVLEYVEGRSLQKILDETKQDDGMVKPFEKELVLDWSRQLCELLGYLHSRKPAVIHRDIKPSNIMLCTDGTIRLLDFGSARTCKRNAAADTKNLGTRGYAAPEQYGEIGQTDARTDIYNLGATLCHLLTGYSPVDTFFEIKPIGSLVPRYRNTELEKILIKCCKASPDERFQNCDELLQALERSRKTNRFIAAIQKWDRCGFMHNIPVLRNQIINHYKSR